MSYTKKYKIYKSKYLNAKMAEQNQKGGVPGVPVATNPVDEIHFWGRQLTEHAFFLKIGIQDGQLRQEASELQDLWLNYMNTTFINKGIDSDKIFLDEKDFGILGKIDINEANKILEKTLEFNRKIVAILNEDKEWIGWIFPALAQHMLEEAEYFDRKLNGSPFSTKEEIDIAKRHHMTELAGTSHLLDPSPENEALFKKIIDLSQQNMKVANWSEADIKELKGIGSNDLNNLLLLSIKYGQEIIKFSEETGAKIDSRQLKSIISPIMAHHNDREFKRLTAVLELIPIK